MAMKLNAGSVGRADVFLIDPTNILVDHKDNGRWKPHGEVEVQSMVASFKDNGQLQPVQVRRITENKVQLVLGYRRYEAAVAYNKLYPNEPMKLKCTVADMNEEEALQRNIVENRERESTSAIDDAHNQRRLREDFGWTEKRIADFFKMSQPYVSILRKLLTLPTEVQTRVHEGTLSVQAALAVADLPAAEQQKALEPSTNGATPSSQEVISNVREAKIQKGGKQARSLKEVREFFEGLTGPAEAPEVKALADLVCKFIQGRISEKTMEQRLNTMLLKAAA